MKNTVYEERAKHRRTFSMNKSIKFLAYPSVLLFLFYSLLGAGCARHLLSQQGNRTIPMPEVLEPVDFVIAKEKIVIAETTHIAIYSLKDLHLEKKFARRGEGPGEFDFPPHITAYPDRILVNTMGKLIHYSYEGSLIEETKIKFPYNYGTWPMLPVGENFVGFPTEIEKINAGAVRISNVGRLYNGEFEPIKQLCEAILPLVPPPPPPPGQGTRPKPTPQQDFNVIPDYVDYAVVEDKIFLADNRKGLHISVFDQVGDLLYEIDKAYKPMRVSKKYEDDYMKRQKAHPDWENWQRRFTYRFRKNFPAFSSFKVAGDKIYITTHEKKDGKYEIVVMDLQGHILKRSFSFPLPPYQDPSYSFTLFSNQFEIYQDRIYSLSYNDETDTYELHIHAID